MLASLERLEMTAAHANFDTISRLAPFFALQKKLQALQEDGKEYPKPLCEDKVPLGGIEGKGLFFSYAFYDKKKF